MWDGGEAYLVLHGFVASRGREVLRHGGRVGGGEGWCALELCQLVVERELEVQLGRLKSRGDKAVGMMMPRPWMEC
jgi:hypothetical protein